MSSGVINESTFERIERVVRFVENHPHFLEDSSESESPVNTRQYGKVTSAGDSEGKHTVKIQKPSDDGTELTDTDEAKKFENVYDINGGTLAKDTYVIFWLSKIKDEKATPIFLMQASAGGAFSARADSVSENEISFTEVVWKDGKSEPVEPDNPTKGTAYERNQKVAEKDEIYTIREEIIDSGGSQYMFSLGGGNVPDPESAGHVLQAVEKNGELIWESQYLRAVEV